VPAAGPEPSEPGRAAGGAATGPGSALATLSRGTSFFGNGRVVADDGARAGGVETALRAKVIGNGLRELDRFLNLLIDEVADLVVGPGPDAARFRAQRNTANKLRRVRAAMALPSPDHDRLLAIARSRDCLFHCAGIVRRGDDRTAARLTVGWPEDGPPRAYAVGERIVVGAADLNGVCRFYDRVAADLLAACDRHLGR